MNKKILVIGLVFVFLISLTSFSFLIYKQFNKSDQKNNIADDTIQINDDQEQNISNQSCTVDGVEYLDGESFPSPDSCNTCTCDNGIVSCTEKACTENFTKKINIYSMGTSDEVLYSINLGLELPSEASISDIDQDELIINYGNTILYIGVSYEDIIYFLNFKEKLNSTELPNNQIENLRRLNELPDYYNSIIGENIEHLKKKWFTYSESYTESDCYPSEEVSNPISCYVPILGVPQTNNDSVTTLDVYCGVDDEADALTCDQIMETLYVEKVL